MNIISTALPDVKLLEPQVFGDARGFFLESYNRRKLNALGIECEFVQDNHSRSEYNVLRGLHYQIRQPQGKLVRAIVGEILDVAVDMRRSSPTFGKAVSFQLSAANKLMAWIPAGFAHGFLVRSACAEVLYKATDYYAPEYERSLLWNDPALRIDWGLGEAPLLSSKDRLGVLLNNAEVFD